MTGLQNFLRQLAAVVLAFVSAVFFLISVSLPWQLQRQAKADRVYYSQFQKAAVFTADHARRHGGRLPSDSDFQTLGDTGDAGSIWASLSASGGDCGGEFKARPQDDFTLWFWRGEWGECYAYPSGRTTLHMSVSGYLRAGLWWEWALWWVIALGAGYLAVKLGKRAADAF